MIKAIIFDLDQTLLNRTKTIRAIFEEQFSIYLSNSKLGKNDFVDEMIILDNNGYSKKDEIFLTFCKNKEVDLCIAEAMHEDFVENLRKHPILMDSAIETLKRLGEKYRLGLITNGSESTQASKIKSLGIQHYFQSILVSGRFGKKKPSKEIYMASLKELNCTPKEAIFIGDNPQLDVIAPMNLGMKAIWFQNSHYDPPPKCDATVNKLLELIPAIAEIDLRNIAD